MNKNFFNFYNREGSITSGEEGLTTSLKNLCGNSDYKLRREVMEGTVKVYTLQNTLS